MRKRTRILVTGSSGLIGRALVNKLRVRGTEVREFDLSAASESTGDIRNLKSVANATVDCHGIVHLAAVSRVITGENQPLNCMCTNVGGTANILQAAEQSDISPWVIYGSSREVYGQAPRLPVSEDAPIAPINVYGRSKAISERLVESAKRSLNLRACTVRFSNVYGAQTDHSDRVIPAFICEAGKNGVLRVDGHENVFDFTHLGDVCNGLISLIDHLLNNEPAPDPIHFVSGTGTTLGELAKLALRVAGSKAEIKEAPSRHYDVSSFIGNSARANSVLGWEPKIGLEEGLRALLKDYVHASKI